MKHTRGARAFADRFVDAGRRRACAPCFGAWIADCTATTADTGRRPSPTEPVMTWTTPVIEEVSLGMEVTSYESAEVEF